MSEANETKPARPKRDIQAEIRAAQFKVENDRRAVKGLPPIVSSAPAEVPAPVVKDGDSNWSPDALARFRRATSKSADGFQYRLKSEPLPGFMTRWVNDDGARLDHFLGLGWDFVTNGDGGVKQHSTDPGNKVSRVVGHKQGGGEMRAYLLKIPQEGYDYYKQLEREQQKQVDETIRRGLLGDHSKTAGDKRYIPREGISVKTETR